MYAMCPPASARSGERAARRHPSTATRTRPRRSGSRSGSARSSLRPMWGRPTPGSSPRCRRGLVIPQGLGRKRSQSSRTRSWTRVSWSSGPSPSPARRRTTTPSPPCVTSSRSTGLLRPTAPPSPARPRRGRACLGSTTCSRGPMSARAPRPSFSSARTRAPSFARTTPARRACARSPSSTAPWAMLSPSSMGSRWHRPAPSATSWWGSSRCSRPPWALTRRWSSGSRARGIHQYRHTATPP
mmetsp:Transcript_2632/g.8886  ORF Transcript_2632/g.8886 Transcript_2632/m.8886 type:complete len:242 (-) Transcript_2632:3075-3800(-)